MSDQVQLCQICGINSHKYTCPRCAMQTCSVDCVKRHKNEKECSGERDKTHFVTRDQYNYSHLMSDYTYLEDISRQSDTLTRERLKAPPSMDFRSKMLLKKAREMGIQYDVLPAIMSRHKMNKTNYSNNKHQLYWTIECCFSRKNVAQKILEHSIPHAKSLRGVFENMLFAENPQGKGEYKTIRYQLREFKDAGIDQLVVGLKKEAAHKNTFVDLTPHLDKSIRELLRGERVIEFPTIYIWIRDELDEGVTLEEKIFVEYRPNHRSKRPQKGKKDDNNPNGEQQSEPDPNEQQVSTADADEESGINATELSEASNENSKTEDRNKADADADMKDQENEDAEVKEPTIKQQTSEIPQECGSK
ncbi:hypothetical protein BDB00DRAFT_411451 [Zychaea mexicana]|uniref:uncharacterized protein n=1 Tax=Zychaea mexicana TaxID=64656 RepID=UPI0022FE2EA9|nr:uncharacterized protein BDB00DRAFT_411451 [Zychaea mexicana]KAI9492863.1 hypothetical protein BDB00DRAFT_411451 [Zychaea mexicana]